MIVCGRFCASIGRKANICPAEDLRQKPPHGGAGAAQAQNMTSERSGAGRKGTAFCLRGYECEVPLLENGGGETGQQRQTEQEKKRLSEHRNTYNINL